MRSNSWNAAAGVLFVLCAVGTCAAADPPSRLDGHWADLASPDEARATRAALSLAATKEAVSFLKDHLKPVKVDPKRLAQLIAQLDSEEFTKREEAAAELDYYGKFIKADLEKAKTDNASAEVKKRVQGLLDRSAGETADPAAAPALAGRSVSVSNVNGKVTILIDGKPLDLTPKSPPAPRPAWVRAARAAAVLEHVGTPEARKVLEGMADGEAEAPPTKAAKEALDRLKKESGR
jgi:hypothetical protein